MQMLAVVSFKSFSFAVDRQLNGISNTSCVSASRYNLYLNHIGQRLHAVGYLVV